MPIKPAPTTARHPQRTGSRMSGIHRRDRTRPPLRAGFSLPTVRELPRAPVRDAGTW